MDELYDFLGNEAVAEELDVKIGGDFMPTGFTAPWIAEVLYSHGSQSEFSREEIGYDIKRAGGGWYWYYWKNLAAADAAAEHVGAQYGANTEWVFRTATADVLNFASEDARAKWGTDIFYSSQVTGWGSPKYRHEWQLVSLPAAVATIAASRGWDTPGFSLDALHELDGDSGEKECQALIGGGGVPWDESVLGVQRAELWAALGEENPKAFRKLGSLTQAGKQDKLATTSENLNYCLGIFYRAWPHPLWCQVTGVPDPRHDAVSSSGNRLTRPTLTALYVDEAAALASLGEEAGTVAAAQADAPQIPAIWKDYPDQWQTQLVEITSKVGSKPLPVIYEDAGGADALGCSLEELTAWIEYQS